MSDIGKEIETGYRATVAYLREDRANLEAAIRTLLNGFGERHKIKISGVRVDAEHYVSGGGSVTGVTVEFEL